MQVRNLKVVLFIILFMAPLFIHVRTTFRSYSPIYFALPHIYSGDEPHYLVMVSSIIKDFDFDVSNNYENARVMGTNDLGERFKGKAIDHHTFFFNPKSHKVILWNSVFNFEWGKTNFLPPEVPYPRYPEKEDINLINFKEYSFRPIGVPLLLSFFLWPFRYFGYSNLYGSFAIFIMAIVALAGVFFFYKLLQEFCQKNAGLFTLVFAFGTPFWWYARSIYPDPLLCSLLLGALYFVLIRKNYLISGFLMGFSFLVKIQFLPIIIVFLLFIGLNKKWKELALFSLPFLLFVSIQLVYSYLVFRGFNFFYYTIGVPYANIIKTLPSDLFIKILQRFKNILFSPLEGLLIFSPFLLFSFLGFHHIVGQEKDKGFFIVSLLAVYFLLHWLPLYWYEEAGFHYGPRHLLPIIPLFFLPLTCWYNSSNRILKRVFIVLAFISVFINLQGVFMYTSSCHAPPWFLIEILFKKLM